MTQIVRSIAQYCQDNLITDGCCGVRELIAWVQSFYGMWRYTGSCSLYHFIFRHCRF